MRKTGLPLPLGLNAIRRDLEPTARKELEALLLSSIRYGMEHRAETVQYALKFARDIDEEVAEEFVGMYVNDLTLDIGDRGRRGLDEFLRLGRAAGIIPNALPVEFV